LPFSSAWVAIESYVNLPIPNWPKQMVGLYFTPLRHPDHPAVHAKALKTPWINHP
jgi:hypothetical protein